MAKDVRRVEYEFCQVYFAFETKIIKKNKMFGEVCFR